jgi:hypothetical protein
MIPLLVYAGHSGTSFLPGLRPDAAVSVLLREIAKEDPRELVEVIQPDNSFNEGYLSGRYPTSKLVFSRVASPLQQLFGLGTKAIPSLLAHLGSSYPTRLVIGDVRSEILYRSLFDSRHDSKALPYFLYYRRPVAGERDDTYCIREGDIAFLALGKITNRWYWPVRRSIGYFVVSSPVFDAELKEETVLACEGMDDARLLSSLSEDVRHPDSRARESGAMARISTYFPADAAAVFAQRIEYLEHHRRGYPESAPGDDNGLVIAMRGVDSPRVDEICFSILEKMDRDKRLFSREYFLAAEVMMRIGLKPNYHAGCLSFAKRHEAEYGPYFKDLFGTEPPSQSWQDDSSAIRSGSDCD